jgi:lipid-binding SYLF domain-containing protein
MQTHTSPGSPVSPLARFASIITVVTVTLLVPALGAPVLAQSAQAERVRAAGVVLGEIMAAPDRSIPQSVLEKAEAIAVFPSTIKVGLIVGGQRGRGLISVREQDGEGWSPPAFLTLTGGSLGLQVGGQAVDIVLVIMNRRGLENLLQNQFEIGGEASATTDIQLRAQILSYSRSRGLFAGINLRGTAIRQDLDGNELFYGERLPTRDIVIDGKATSPKSPEDVAEFHAMLRKYVPRRVTR